MKKSFLLCPFFILISCVINSETLNESSSLKEFVPALKCEGTYSEIPVYGLNSEDRIKNEFLIALKEEYRVEEHASDFENRYGLVRMGMYPLTLNGMGIRIDEDRIAELQLDCRIKSISVNSIVYGE